MERSGLDRSGPNHKRTTAQVGVTPKYGTQTGRARSSRCFGPKTADLAVSEPVVDQREEMASSGDLADVAASTVPDALLDRGDARLTVGTGDGFDGRPAQMCVDPILVIPPRVTLVSDSRWRV